MDKTELQLIELERTMGLLCASRRDRVAAAEASIKRANRDFDRRALPVARKINQLREQLEKVETPAPRQLDTTGTTHDPEWSQEDIDHYYELKRGSRNGRK